MPSTSNASDTLLYYIYIWLWNCTTACCFNVNNKNNRTPNLGTQSEKTYSYMIIIFWICGHIYNDRQFWDVVKMKHIICYFNAC